MIVSWTGIYDLRRTSYRISNVPEVDVVGSPENVVGLLDIGTLDHTSALLN